MNGYMNVSVCRWLLAVKHQQHRLIEMSKSWSRAVRKKQKLTTEAVKKKCRHEVKRKYE